MTLKEARAWFASVPAGRHGFDPTDFIDVQYDNQNELRVYLPNGEPWVVPFKQHAVVRRNRRRIRLVELFFFRPTTGKSAFAAYAWQGEHGFHLLEEPRVTDAVQAIQESEHHYYTAYPRDGFLDVDVDI